MAEIPAVPEVTLGNTTVAKPTPYPAPPSITPTKEERALTRSVADAVQIVNQAGFAGAGREVTFSLDQATKRPIVKVVELATKEVVQQWPPEYLLRLAAETKK